MRLATCALIVCVGVLSPFSRGQAQESPNEPIKSQSEPRAAAEDVDVYVQRTMQKRHIPGISVAVVNNGKVVLAKGYGLASVELKVPATADTVYQLASVTKTFTATAIMMLEREGTLAIEDKITERLPDLPKAWKDVTVGHLLSHTSGIKSYTSVNNFHKLVRKDFTPREILDLVAREPLEFKPGEKFHYSNTGYFLLGMLIEKVSGKSYGEFMAERIFKPLGMTQTRVNDLRAVVPNRAQGYEWNGKELRNGEYVSPSQPYAAGMLLSSVSDLVKWDAALSTHSLLDGRTFERMWSPTRLADGKESGYGYGWETSKGNGIRRVSHDGGISGFSTDLSRYPDKNLTVIVLTNAEGGHAGVIARKIAGLFLPELAGKVEKPIVDEDATTTRRLRRMFEDALKGEVDEGLFTDQAKKQLVPLIRGSKEHVASFGSLKTFDLLERKASGGGLRLRYRAALENETVKVSFSLDKDGKIQAVGIQSED